MKPKPSSVRLATSLNAGIVLLAKLVEDNSMTLSPGYNSRYEARVALVKLLKAAVLEVLEVLLTSKRMFSRKLSVSFSSGELNLRDNEEFEVP